MNDGARFFIAAVVTVTLTLLTAMSPALGALAANLLRPALESLVKQAQNLARLFRAGSGSSKS